MLLEFRNVEKYYREFRALYIPSLLLNEGIWWLQGENGSGKTTFLKIVAGIHPFLGEVTLNHSIPLKKQRLRFVSLVNYAEAEPLYPPFLTAADLVEIYLTTKSGDRHKTMDLLQSLNIFDAYRKPLRTWSSGMLKKLSLVLAFTGNPKWILLDEPLITLDTAAIDIICKTITSSNGEGVSFIITSHQALSHNQLSFTNRLQAINHTILKV